MIYPTEPLNANYFIDNLPLPTPENTMTSEQKYWYNRGHEDGRKLNANIDFSLLIKQAVMREIKRINNE